MGQTEQDFPVGARVRFVGGHMWGEIQGKMATVVTKEDLAANWPHDPEMRDGCIPCRLDEIGRCHLYWAPRPESIEFVSKPKRAARCTFSENELEAHIETVKRLIRGFEDKNVKHDEEEPLRNAKHALRKIEDMFGVPGCIPRGVYKE